MGRVTDNYAIRPAIDGLLAEALLHLQQGRTAAAEAIYEKLSEERPEHWEGHMGLAHIRYEQRKMGHVLKLLPLAIQAEAQCMPAYQMFWALGVHGGITEMAIEYLEYGAQQMPTEAVLFEWLVTLYAIDGRDDDLRQCLAHYARLRGKSPAEMAALFARSSDIAPEIRHRINTAAGW